jgi:hypothetical protein
LPYMGLPLAAELHSSVLMSEPVNRTFLVSPENSEVLNYFVPGVQDRST